MRIGITVNLGNYESIRLDSNDFPTSVECIKELVGIGKELGSEDVIESLNLRFGDFNSEIPEVMSAFFDKLDEVNSSFANGCDSCYICHDELTDLVKDEIHSSDRVTISKNLEVYVCRRCCENHALTAYIQHLQRKLW